MNIFSILPIFTVLFCIWCCVASPQSNSQTSPPRCKARAEWFLVDDGWAEAVPRKVMLREEMGDLEVDIDVRNLLNIVKHVHRDCYPRSPWCPFLAPHR